MNWKNQFTKRILGRGKQYYEDGCVLHIEKKGNGLFHALVEGEDDYFVRIQIYQDGEASFYCTCPYAKEGNNCKHAAAVLFALEEEGEPVSIEEDPSSEEVNTLIDTMDINTLRSFLKEYVQEDTQFRDTLLSRFSSHTSTEKFNAVMDQISKAVKIVSGYPSTNRNGRMKTLADTLSAVLDEYIPEYLDDGQGYEAMKILNHAYIEVLRMNMMDDFGFTHELCYSISVYWSACLESMNEDEVNRMRSEMEKIAEFYFASDLADYIRYFLDEEMRTEDQIREYLQEMMEELSGYPGPRSPSFYNSIEDDHTLIERILRYMGKLNYTKEEQMQWLEENSRFSETKEILLEEAEKNQQWNKAEELILYFMKENYPDPDMISNFYSRLNRIYIQTGQKEKLKNLLIKEVNCHELSYQGYNQLKPEIQDDEIHKAVINAFIHSDLPAFLICSMLYQEKMYGELEERILDTRDFNLLDQYLEVLCMQDPETIISIYIGQLRAQVIDCKSGAHYRRLLKLLDHLHSVPEAREEAEDLAEEWRITYSRRSALMEELRVLRNSWY